MTTVAPPPESLGGPAAGAPSFFSQLNGIVPAPTPAKDLAESHKVVVSVGVLVVMAVIFTEGAGHSAQAADLVILLLMGVFLILGITYAGRFQQFASTYPYQP